MSHWPLTPADISRPAYRSLAQGIAAAIASGALRPGARLPPHREMAWQLGVSVQTVSRAYEELIRADLVSGEVGRGSFVRSPPGEPVEVPWHRASGDRAPIDLSMMTPVRLPQIADAWAESLSRVANRLPDQAMYSFRPRQTAARYAPMASAWLARCGMIVRSSRILVTNGMTPAMFVALMTVAKPGEIIATEASTCHPLLPVARHLHLRLQGIAGDARGMLPEALAEAARASAGQMKAVFLLPSGAGPEARMIDRDRREALARAAEEAGLAILESDPLGPLAARRPPPLASFAPDRSFYFTGLSKCLAPGLRLGFLVMPEFLAERTVDRHLSVAWMATPLMAEIASDWIESGLADRLLGAQRAELSLRNRMALRLLGPDCTGFRHGLHRWLPLPEGLGEATFLRQALQQDVAVAGGSGFAVSATDPAIRICLGGAGLRDLERALLRLAALLPAGHPAGDPAGQLRVEASD